MNAKEFLKPTFSKLLVFLFIGIFYLYFAGEGACGASLFFAFCYKAYGFPFLYAITGQVDSASGYIKTLPFGNYFIKLNGILFNPATLFFDIVLIYMLSCLIFMLFKNMKFRH